MFCFVSVYIVYASVVGDRDIGPEQHVCVTFAFMGERRLAR